MPNDTPTAQPCTCADRTTTKHSIYAFEERCPPCIERLAAEQHTQWAAGRDAREAKRTLGPMSTNHVGPYGVSWTGTPVIR